MYSAACSASAGHNKGVSVDKCLDLICVSNHALFKIFNVQMYKFNFMILCAMYDVWCMMYMYMYDVSIYIRACMTYMHVSCMMCD